jgi:hypothetical protein
MATAKTHLRRVSVGSRSIDVVELLLETAISPDLNALIKGRQGADVDLIRAVRERTAPDVILSEVESAYAYALEVFEHERVRATPLNAAKIVLKYATRKQYGNADDLVLAALILLVAEQLLEVFPSENRKPVTPGWRHMELALLLGRIRSDADLHHAVMVRRSTAPAVAARQAPLQRRRAELRRALAASQVKATPKDVAQWRGQGVTAATREAARKDLVAIGAIAGKKSRQSRKS